MLARIIYHFRMVLVPAPTGESTSLKSPVVEVEAVDMAPADTKETIATMENTAAVANETMQSEYETDSDDSGSDLEAELEILHDEELRRGSK